MREEVIDELSRRGLIKGHEGIGNDERLNRIKNFIFLARQNPTSFYAGLDFLDEVEAALAMQPDRKG